nr:unnamed protein product [Callosobruchus chinensis]
MNRLLTQTTYNLVEGPGMQERSSNFNLKKLSKMDVEEMALVYYVQRKYLKKKQKKKLWIHPFLSDRSQSGVFTKLYHDLRKYRRKFFNYVRISIESFDELLELCRNDLSKQDTILRKSICPEEKLFVTLRYLASGCTFMELHYNYRLGYTTIGTIIREVCGIICGH